MQIKSSQQSKDGPADKPIVVNPVMAALDIPLFYATERGPVPWHHSIFCGQIFAETVLAECEKLLKVENLALVHLGVYNPRQARHKDGTPIIPIRWSNHAYGVAMDFKGVVTDGGNGEFLDMAALKNKKSQLLENLTAACRKTIEGKGRKPEIVDEGNWLHIGFWP